MTRAQLLSHYLDTAQTLRAAGCRRWARVYARLAVQIMEA